MKSERKTSIATGILFLVATIAALAAAALDPSLIGSDHLAEVADHAGLQTAAALFYLVAAATSVGIAIALYPLLRKAGGALALGSVVFRTIEAVFYTLAVVSLLSVFTLSKQLATAPADGRATINALGDMLLSMRDHSNVVAVFALSLGALMYYTLFFLTRLIPRWLSGWGAAAALLMLTACLIALSSDTPVTSYTLLILPIFVQELALALWLLAKGFTTCPSPPVPSPEFGMSRPEHPGPEL